MRTYQKHPVTVESQAIAVTAEFVIDVYSSFAKLDERVVNLVASGQAQFMYDGHTFFRVDPYNRMTEEDFLIVDTWNLLFRILKTVHANAFSHVYNMWEKRVQRKEEGIEEDPE